MSPSSGSGTGSGWTCIWGGKELRIWLSRCGGLGDGSLGGGDWSIPDVGRKVCCERVSASLAGNGSSVFVGVFAAEGASGLAIVSFPRVMGASISTETDERASATCTLVRGTEGSAGVSGSVGAGEVMVALLCLFFSGKEVEVLAEFLSPGSAT